MAFSTNSRMAAIGRICRKICPPTQPSYWHYKQWRDAGTVIALMHRLHEQVREQVKKSQVVHIANH
jgi:hypothetical protein